MQKHGRAGLEGPQPFHPGLSRRWANTAESSRCGAAGVTATERPPTGQDNPHRAPRLQGAGTGAQPALGACPWCWHSPRGAAVALLEAGTAPQMMQGHLPMALCPLDPHFQQGQAWKLQTPERFPTAGSHPQSLTGVSGVSWAGALPLAVPMSQQEQPLNLSAIPTGVLDAQGGSRGCANTSWPHPVPLCLVTGSPGSHTGQGWAAATCSPAVSPLCPQEAVGYQAQSLAAGLQNAIPNPFGLQEHH